MVNAGTERRRRAKNPAAYERNKKKKEPSSLNAVASDVDKNSENDKENELADESEYDIIDPAACQLPNSKTSKSRKNNNEDFEDLGNSKEDKPSGNSDGEFDDLTMLQMSASASNTTGKPLETNRHPDAEALLADGAHDLHSPSDNATLESNKSDEEESFEEIDGKTE